MAITVLFLAFLQISWADIQYFNLIEIYNYLGFGDTTAKNKTMKELFDRISQIPQIKSYLARRKHTDL